MYAFPTIPLESRFVFQYLVYASIISSSSISFSFLLAMRDLRTRQITRPTKLKKISEAEMMITRKAQLGIAGIIECLVKKEDEDEIGVATIPLVVVVEGIFVGKLISMENVLLSLLTDVATFPA